MTAATHQTTLVVAPGHPALAGHFPGRPIVPGVVLLERVLSEAEHWLGGSLHVPALVHAKFTAPLLPQEQAQLQLRLEGNELRFRVARADTLIAQGALRIATESRA